MPQFVPALPSATEHSVAGFDDVILAKAEMRGEKFLVHPLDHVEHALVGRVEQQNVPGAAGGKCPHIAMEVANHLVADVTAM